VRVNVSFAMDGHAGVLDAARLAVREIESERSPIHVIGGVESYLHPDTLLELQASGRLAAEGVRSGFAPGEGACFIALASSEARAALRLPSLARISKVHAAREEQAADDREPLGRALTEALIGVLAPESGAPIVDDIYCDLNGERARTDEWGFALLRTRRSWREPCGAISAAGECGDLGAASGAFSILMAVWASVRRFATGPNAVVWNSSWGGLKAAALLVR